jgi:DNA-binding NtrC family response regulator
MTLELPPLRSYKDSLEILANVFLEQSAAAHEKKAPRLGPAALARLQAYDFPGNVRELRNAIEHALILATGDEIRPEDLPRPMLPSAAGAAPRGAAARPPSRRNLRAMRELWLAPLEQRYLTDLVAEHDGNVRRAAAAAGVNPVTFYRMLRRRGITLERRARKD